MTEPSTIDQTTQASHPGGIKTSPFKWLMSYPTWPLVWFVPLCLFVALAIFVHWLFWIPVAFFAWANRFYWRRVHDHFMFGCANPAMIVNMEPMLIASATDLTKGGGEFPVIKIVEKNIKTANGETPQLGTRLVTVALYQQHPDDDGSMPRWRTFDPRPVDCVTSDVSAMQRVMASLGSDDWQSLDDGLAKLPKPRVAGQYLITDSGAIREEG